jgi:hypothetical protein
LRPRYDVAHVVIVAHADSYNVRISGEVGRSRGTYGSSIDQCAHRILGDIEHGCRQAGIYQA